MSLQEILEVLDPSMKPVTQNLITIFAGIDNLLDTKSPFKAMAAADMVVALGELVCLVDGKLKPAVSKISLVAMTAASQTEEYLKGNKTNLFPAFQTAKSLTLTFLPAHAELLLTLQPLVEMLQSQLDRILQTKPPSLEAVLQAGRKPVIGALREYQRGRDHSTAFESAIRIARILDLVVNKVHDRSFDHNDLSRLIQEAMELAILVDPAKGEVSKIVTSITKELCRGIGNSLITKENMSLEQFALFLSPLFCEVLPEHKFMFEASRDLIFAMEKWGSFGKVSFPCRAMRRHPRIALFQCNRYNQVKE